MKTLDWNEMFESAERILALEPWITVGEEMIFAVKPHADGPAYFVSFMGRMGEHHAVAYYKGREGLSFFRQAQEADGLSRNRVESLLLSEHLQVAFESRKNVLPTDLTQIKACGKRYRGKWPVFRTQRPARMPWTASGGEADVLRILMKSTLPVISRIQSGEDLVRPFYSENFFLIDHVGRDSECRVSELPLIRHTLQAELPGGALDKLPRAKIRIEADLALMLAPVGDVPKGEPPYFPFILLMVDADSGLVMGFGTLTTKDGLAAALVTLPDAITRILKEANVVPEVIFARHPILVSALEAYSRAYGVNFEYDEDLPQADAAIEHLMDFMAR